MLAFNAGLEGLLAPPTYRSAEALRHPKDALQASLSRGDARTGALRS
jgi:hypothetical protein